MKQLLSAVVLMLFAAIKTFGQCPNTNSGTFCPTFNGAGLTLNTITEFCEMVPGDYQEISNLVAGNTYRISFCNAGSNNPPPTDYNSFMTVYGPGGFVTFNDDFCGTNSQVEFVAPASGTYRVLCNVSGNCSATSFSITPATITLVNAPSSSATVSAINRASTNPTNAGLVNYTVTFSGSVSGLTTSNFSLTTTGGISGASVGTPTGSGTTWTVPINTGAGNGTIRLDLANATGLSPSVTTPYTSGQVYDIDKTGPSIIIGAPSANSASCGSITYTVTYTGASTISLVDGNIALNTTGNASANLAVSGSGTSARTVTLNNFTGTGTLGISIAANTSGDAVGNNAAAAGPSATFSVSPPPSATISYSGSPYCNSGTASVTLSGSSGGAFVSTSGLNINSSSGEVNLATSTPGTYTVTYTIAASGGCSPFQTTAGITITAAPSATINYSGSPYCNSGTASVTLSGSLGGSFSSTGGLNINSSSGEVYLATSTPGTYTVTYTIAASGGCSQFQTTAGITITTASSATISYSGSPYCNSGTASASMGGTWISNHPSYASVTNAGLVTGITTGAVNFTFTEAATGCSTTTNTITIKATPTSDLKASQVDVCPNTEVTLDAHCSIPTATVIWNPGAPTVTPNAANISYFYKASCVVDGCVGNESSVEVRTHRILVDMKDLDVGPLPLPIVRAVKDNMEPTNQIHAPVFPRRWTFIANGCDASESAVFKLSGPVNFSSIDNAATYTLFANDAGGFYSIDHPNYGNGGSFPNGTYSLIVDLRSTDGVSGPFPKNRVATGTLLATRTLQFTVGNQAARIGLVENTEELSDSNEKYSWISIFPNPVYNQVSVQLSGQIGEEVQLNLMNLQGQLLLQQSVQLSCSREIAVLNVIKLPSGIYLLKAGKGRKVKTLKVLKVD